MELPDPIIAQAEAAALTNRNAEIRQHSQKLPSTTQQATASEECQSLSSENDTTRAEGSRTTKTPETPIEQVPPVAYGPQLGQVDLSQDGIDTKAKVAGKVLLYALVQSASLIGIR